MKQRIEHKVALNSVKAPRAIGPYSQAVRVGDHVFAAGQAGLDQATGVLVLGGAAEQTRKAMENLKAVLESGGLTMADVVKTTVYLVRMTDFAAMNEVYETYFSEPYPARTTVQVAGLPKNALVEIELVAIAAGSKAAGKKAPARPAASKAAAVKGSSAKAKIPEKSSGSVKKEAPAKKTVSAGKAGPAKKTGSAGKAGGSRGGK
jgi:2-iminobutanoate/2-iminopropanoate deaminase